MSTQDSLLTGNLEPKKSLDEMVLDPDTLWTVIEVAHFLKLNPETVRKMARGGELPAIKIRRVWRFRKSSVLKFLTSP